MMSIYIITVSSATAIGPLVASFVIADTANTWRNFSWLCAGIAGLNLILMFLLYPESSFDRPPIHPATPLPAEKADVEEAQLNSVGKQNLQPAHVESQEDITHGVQHVNHIRVPWTSIWFSSIKYNRSVGFLSIFFRPTAFLVYPAVLWAVFIFASPSLLLAPPYLFAATNIGLIQIAALIGFIFGTFAGGWMSDVITTRRILKNGGHVHPEQRIFSILPFALIAPVGCIVIAFACSEKLSWVAVAFGYGMISQRLAFKSSLLRHGLCPDIAITYVVDCYPQFAGECLVAVNAFKNLLAFIFLYTAVEWIAADGWVQVYMIMFMLVSLATLMGVPLYFWGHTLRRMSERIYYPKAAAATLRRHDYLEGANGV
ncbi:hypothetical protein EDD37DRAFT_684070 [Exophiala viscosa]|uniref:uncharacterized protein n=1 Tax=Exophiala viscosa TaxID=2486360 RepID=UPI00219C2EE1|nr:hypothetical protein EDD37DRAFT_684070 [Exophiala viscosa]